MLIRFDDVLARVRARSDRCLAVRELSVADALQAVDVSAMRVAGGERLPIDVDGFVITLWHWIADIGRVAQPAEIGRLAAQLHAATAANDVRTSIPAFDPLAASNEVLNADQSADAAFLRTVIDDLAAPWSSAAATDPLGVALVHGDLHADNVLVGADGPVLVDLELAGVGPPSYDAAPAALSVQRYGADRGSLQSFLQSWPVDPRRWVGFEVCCRVYEAWVTAWAVSQRDGSAASEEEASIRMAAMRGERLRAWRLR